MSYTFNNYTKKLDIKTSYTAANRQSAENDTIIMYYVTFILSVSS